MKRYYFECPELKKSISALGPSKIEFGAWADIPCRHCRKMHHVNLSKALRSHAVPNPKARKRL